MVEVPLSSKYSYHDNAIEHANHTEGGEFETRQLIHA